MPEGPEVKKLSQYLNKFLKKNKILNLKILKGRYGKKLPSGYENFMKNLPYNIKSVLSKGKFIYFTLNKSCYIFNTLGMSGFWTTEKLKHSNLMFETEKGPLYFNDQRNFGTIKFIFSEDELNNKLSIIGPDMLDLNVKLDIFLKRMNLKKNRNKPIAIVLMDQSVISGIGNYLRSEILYLAKISPYRKINSSDDKDKLLSQYELKKLFNIIIKVIWCYYDLSKAIKFKIISQTELLKFNTNKDFFVYQQKQDIYGNNVIREKIGERSIHWVPEIQY